MSIERRHIELNEKVNDGLSTLWHISYEAYQDVKENNRPAQEAVVRAIVNHAVDKANEAALNYFFSLVPATRPAAPYLAELLVSIKSYKDLLPRVSLTEHVAHPVTRSEARKIDFLGDLESPTVFEQEIMHQAMGKSIDIAGAPVDAFAGVIGVDRETVVHQFFDLTQKATTAAHQAARKAGEIATGLVQKGFDGVQDVAANEAQEEESFGAAFRERCERWFGMREPQKGSIRSEEDTRSYRLDMTVDDFPVRVDKRSDSLLTQGAHRESAESAKTVQGQTRKGDLKKTPSRQEVCQKNSAGEQSHETKVATKQQFFEAANRSIKEGVEKEEQTSKPHEAFSKVPLPQPPSLRNKAEIICMRDGSLGFRFKIFGDHPLRDWVKDMVMGHHSEPPKTLTLRYFDSSENRWKSLAVQFWFEQSFPIPRFSLRHPIYQHRAAKLQVVGKGPFKGLKIKIPASKHDRDRDKDFATCCQKLLDEHIQPAIEKKKVTHALEETLREKAFCRSTDLVSYEASEHLSVGEAEEKKGVFSESVVSPCSDERKLPRMIIQNLHGENFSLPAALLTAEKARRINVSNVLAMATCGKPLIPGFVHSSHEGWSFKIDGNLAVYAPALHFLAEHLEQLPEAASLMIDGIIKTVGVVSRTLGACGRGIYDAMNDTEWLHEEKVARHKAFVEKMGEEIKNDAYYGQAMIRKLSETRLSLAAKIRPLLERRHRQIQALKPVYLREKALHDRKESKTALYRVSDSTDVFGDGSRYYSIACAQESWPIFREIQDVDKQLLTLLGDEAVRLEKQKARQSLKKIGASLFHRLRPALHTKFLGWVQSGVSTRSPEEKALLLRHADRTSETQRKLQEAGLEEAYEKKETENLDRFLFLYMRELLEKTVSTPTQLFAQNPPLQRRVHALKEKYDELKRRESVYLDTVQKQNDKGFLDRIMTDDDTAPRLQEFEAQKSVCCRALKELHLHLLYRDLLHLSHSDSFFHEKETLQQVLVGKPLIDEMKKQAVLALLPALPRSPLYEGEEVWLRLGLLQKLLFGKARECQALAAKIMVLHGGRVQLKSRTDDEEEQEQNRHPILAIDGAFYAHVAQARDGHCCYHSVVEGLRRAEAIGERLDPLESEVLSSSTPYMTLRKVYATWLKKNQKKRSFHGLIRESINDYVSLLEGEASTAEEREVIRFFKSKRTRFSQKVFRYCRAVEQKGVWGDRTTLTAISDLFHRKVHMHSNYPAIPSEIFGEQYRDKRPLHLLFGDRHFDALEPERV